MAHANEELLRSGYEAFAKGDLDTVMGIFDDDITWHVPGHNLIAGDYRGHEDVMGFFAQLHELSAGTFTVEPHDFLANDTHVVVLVREQAKRQGKELNHQEAHIWHVANGKATDFWGASTDQAQADEFWS